MQVLLSIPRPTANYMLKWLEDIEAMNCPGYAENYPAEAGMVAMLRRQLAKQLPPTPPS